MTAKIYEIKSGREIKEPELLACAQRAPAKGTKVVKASSRGGQFQSSPDDILKALERVEARM